MVRSATHPIATAFTVESESTSLSKGLTPVNCSVKFSVLHNKKTGHPYSELNHPNGLRASALTLVTM